METNLDLERYEVSYNGRRAPVTRVEAALLQALLERPGRVVSRDALLHGAWEVKFSRDCRRVDAAVHRLRSKIELPIEACYGVGFRWRVEDERTGG
jgi:DNA-binding response OmpR family regulator